jgi:hypothetical protein
LGEAVFNSKTVFVVGAGASQEAGLPIGKELTSKIRSLLDLRIDLGSVKSGDYQIYETLKRKVQNEGDTWHGNNLIGSARHIGEAMQLATSIDTFLESFSHDRETMLLGKLGIAKAILNAERSSKFAPSRDRSKPFNIDGVTDTWYVSLAQQIFSGVSAQNVKAAFEPVSFIIFNYDRCLQVFLVRALQVYFRMTEGEAHSILRDVKFLHPYGSLGSILPSGTDHLPYGADSADLDRVAGRIVTFSETIRDATTLSAIRNEMAEAETAVFLGCAYHPQNVDVLQAPASIRQESRSARVLATTLGLSKSDTSLVRAAIANLIWDQPATGYIDRSIHTFDGRCYDFFGEYWRSMTAPVELAH